MSKAPSVTCLVNDGAGITAPAVHVLIQADLNKEGRTVKAMCHVSCDVPLTIDTIFMQAQLERWC